MDVKNVKENIKMEDVGKVHVGDTSKTTDPVGKVHVGKVHVGDKG